MITKVIHSLVGASAKRNRREHFNDGDDTSSAWIKFFVSLLTLLIVLVFLVFVGQFLWNFAIAGEGKGEGVLTIAKPITLWQVLALYLLVGLLFGQTS